MSRRLRAIIVGAGLGGLAAAQALRRAGCEVRIVEQSQTLAEVGAGISLSPNAVAVLRDLELEEPLRKRAFQPTFHVFRDWKSGRPLFRVNVRAEYEKRFHAPQLSVHRADLLEILQMGLPTSAYVLGAKCVGVTQRGATAVVLLENGTELDADFVIGADGIKSAVRESLFGKDDPKFTGNVAWRFTLPVDGSESRQIEAATTNWLGPGGHVVHYYIRSGELINVVAVFETEKWVSESWSTLGDKQELLQAYTGWNERLLSLLRGADTCFKWGLFDRAPLQSWSLGCLTLLGNSAHPMLPFLGQGAAMAMEDGLMLGILMNNRTLPVEDVLKRYEQLRLPRTARVQLGSRGRAHENHLRSPVARFARNLKFKWRQLTNPHATLHNGEWIYGYRPHDAVSAFQVSDAS